MFADGNALKEYNRTIPPEALKNLNQRVFHGKWQIKKRMFCPDCVVAVLSLNDLKSRFNLSQQQANSLNSPDGRRSIHWLAALVHNAFKEAQVDFLPAIFCQKEELCLSMPDCTLWPLSFGVYQILSITPEEDEKIFEFLKTRMPSLSWEKSSVTSSFCCETNTTIQYSPPRVGYKGVWNDPKTGKAAVVPSNAVPPNFDKNLFLDPSEAKVHLRQHGEILFVNQWRDQAPLRKEISAFRDLVARYSENKPSKESPFTVDLGAIMSTNEYSLTTRGPRSHSDRIILDMFLLVRGWREEMAMRGLLGLIIKTTEAARSSSVVSGV